MAGRNKLILSNSVGTITAETVKIKNAKGQPTVLKLEDIVSVIYKLKRKYVYAVLCFLFGLGALLVFLIPAEGGRQLSFKSLLVPLALILAGIANLLGYYVIEIQTNTASIRLEDVEFNKLKDGRIFIETLEKLISERTTTAS